LDDDSDSELGDNVDEDSNGNIYYTFYWFILTLYMLAEDYYQNDYPEEEDSDEFEDRK
jgi:hypothetical protein